MRVLLVEDNDTAGRSVASALSEPFHVASVPLGRKVPDTIRDFDPDVLILDVSLPYMNGITVAALLREDWPDLPIILATREFEVNQSALPPRTHFLPKPFAVDTLKEMLEAINHRSSSSDL